MAGWLRWICAGRLGQLASLIPPLEQSPWAKKSFTPENPPRNQALDQALDTTRLPRNGDSTNWISRPVRKPDGYGIRFVALD